MELHSDPVDAIGGSTHDHSLTTGKRKLVRRPLTSGSGEGGAVASSSPPLLSPPPGATQTVSSEAEGNALIKRIRQLESEGAMLSNTLTKVCDENARLTGQVASLENKVQQLAEEPLKNTSVLRSLFEPEKTGWFGGSKSTAREQLERLSEALQSEFMSYKAAHASSNDEVQALVGGLQAAHLNAQELSNTIKEQQQLISGSPLSISIHVAALGDDIGGTAAVKELQEELRRVHEQTSATEEQLRSAQTELRAMKLENTRLRNEAISSFVSAGPPIATPTPRRASEGPSASEKAATEALTRLKKENEALQERLAQARNSVAEKEKEVVMQRQQLTELQNMLSAKDSVHAKELESMRHQLADSFSASLACRNCGDLRQEVEKAKSEVDTAHQTVQELRNQILDLTVKHEAKYTALERKYADNAHKLSEKDQQLRHATSADDYDQLKSEQETLTREIGLYKKRIAYLEDSRSVPDGGLEASALDEAKMLQTLQSSQERIAKIEFERDQLEMQLQQAQSYAVSRDAEARQLQQRAEDDKQRVAFLVKKSATLTADARSANAQLEAFKDQFEKQSLELKQEKRNVENMTKLQRQLEETTREKKLLEERLAATQEVEERLVKAKETIAYMELAQNSTISMSQFAQLKAEKEKLQNTMEPLNRKLEEAKSEVDRLKAITDAQQAISSTQNNNVRTWQDQVTALSDSEAKLREKVSMLIAENTRLTEVNASLEQQMNDMQDGIKEMAVHMERDRTNAKTAAEASAQKQIHQLRDDLVQARATIAEVQARDGQYVAEGLYQSVVAEREKALEENKKMQFELEKRTSEINIYRQTIEDLEQENDERVKEIESLQDRYQSDRASLKDRLAAEQKKAMESTKAVTSLTEQVAAMEADLAKRVNLIAELQEKTAKQQRAFEDKCRREEALGDEIKRLNGKILTAQTPSTPADCAAAPQDAASASVGAEAEVNRDKDGSGLVLSSVPVLDVAASSLHNGLGSGAAAAGALEPIAVEAFRKRIDDLQQENDRLAGELKRTQLQNRTEAAEDRQTITALQAHIKSRMSANDRTAYEAAVAKSAALKKNVEALLEENATLRLHAGVAPVPSNSATTSSSVAMAATQQMDLIELQTQLQEQKSTFNMAMEAALKTSETYEARIRELEERLREAEDAAAATLATSPSWNSGRIGHNEAPVDDEADPGPLGQPTRKRTKKIKKKKATLAEQVGAMDDGADILAVSLPVEKSNPVAQVSADAERRSASDVVSQRELAQLQAENAQLKITIANLQLQLRQMEEEVRAAQEDLEFAHVAMDEERQNLNREIASLQGQQSNAQSGMGDVQASTRSINDSFAAGGPSGGSRGNSFRLNSIADSEMQLRRCRDEMERLTVENKNLQNQLAKAEANTKSPTAATAAAVAVAERNSAGQVRKLLKQLKAKDLEIKVLADQLLPTKEKLVEYMAMTDRLGIQYPFPPELEGATVLRLKSLNLPTLPRPSSMTAMPTQGRRSPRSSAKGEAALPIPRSLRSPGSGRASPSLMPEDDDSLR